MDLLRIECNLLVLSWKTADGMSNPNVWSQDCQVQKLCLTPAGWLAQSRTMNSVYSPHMCLLSPLQDSVDGLVPEETWVDIRRGSRAWCISVPKATGPESSKLK